MAKGSGRRPAGKRFLAALAKSRQTPQPLDQSTLPPHDAPHAEAALGAALGPDRLITIRQAQDVFTRYLLDRADQYETESPCWHALADAAQEVANGEAWADFEHGELDGDDLKRRVKSMARTLGARPVDPKLGTDDDGGRSA